MYVHIGQDYMVPVRSIVCIFDMDTATASGRTRLLLERLSQEGRVVDLCDDLPKSAVLLEGLSQDGRVVDLCDDLPKSAVLCTSELGEILYISQISSRTLQKRVEEGKM